MKRGHGPAQRLLPIVLLVACCASVAPVRSAAPLPIELEDVASGRTVEVTAGAPALHVVLFATWCPPCMAELGRLADLQERWGDRGYRLVLVAVRNRHTLERLVKFQQQRQPPGRLLFDQAGTAQRSLDVEQLPTHIVFDSVGDEVGRAGSLRAGVEEMIEGLLQRRDSTP